MILRYFPCHRRRERSLVINGNQFPVCYRCMFMLIGLTFVLPFAMLQFFPPWWQGVIICLGLNLPLVLDGGSQAFGMKYHCRDFYPTLICKNCSYEMFRIKNVYENS
ncbi:DUF2085 domain-containing protein [Aeribacillus kexueae]|uniref:DUF2085 domain-containing protein n=1 Tax=Aeribacillus kexueae TaxID=2078952 RepID=UPI003AF027B0